MFRVYITNNIYVEPQVVVHHGLAEGYIGIRIRREIWLFVLITVIREHSETRELLCGIAVGGGSTSRRSRSGVTGNQWCTLWPRISTHDGGQVVLGLFWTGGRMASQTRE
jgi:hypothetical protein